ncbi:hypothetical protein SAMN04487917_103129 [Arthrobacter sp. yr096]|uniref:CocE/NonD family hydrolase n=1 Tax=Arthrobacter sp. yr096 TaxID=1761750 RepID=UPI0008B52B4C|nr:CocE/NonD family hydrolase [Arthrobacter sp. yr096]SEI95953.1 hypothetical protein SAMN04487917_103129 [Arthrobacter sp. yr096]
MTEATTARTGPACSAEEQAQSDARLGRTYRPGREPSQPLPGAEPHPGFGYRREEHGNMLIERDVAIPTRRGTVYADVFRPRNATQVPVIVGYAPFGKHPHLDIETLWAGSGIPFETLSDFVPWEQFDPVPWTEWGYAIAIVDGVGNWYSEGDATYFTPEEAWAGHDIVEWLAQCDWSTGKVGWGGVSYFAMTAWSVAATKPPHLAAILPWDAASDCYREAFLHAGIPSFPFIHGWMQLTGTGQQRVEDMEAGMRDHPTFDEYWQCRVADWQAVDVPTYAVTEFPNNLHLRGTVEAWRGISSPDKFLEIRGDKEWEGFYQPESVQRQKEFFDRYLKDVDNGVSEWPRVRIGVRTREDQWTFRDETDWPLPDVTYETLWLDADAGTLNTQRPEMAAAVSYASTDDSGAATFDIRFDERVEMTGNAKLRLWISTDLSNDADLFVGVEKLDQHGKRVPFTFSQMYDDGPMGFGWLRASHRALDEERSTPERPWHSHARRDWLVHGKPVPVDIEIWPNSVLFEPGESLRVIVKGTPVQRYSGRFEIVFAPLHNSGNHTIHTGGEFDSHLYLPVIKR